jgi:L-fuculose-phosphate aldolase
MEMEQGRQEMCDIGQRIWMRQYCAGNEGNHSMKVGEDQLLCTPTGISKGFLKPEMICLVDMDGNHLDSNQVYRPTSEVLIHLEIYKKRVDVRAVVHSHPPHATAFALAGMPIPEGIHPEAELFLGHVPFAEFAMPSKPALAESIVPLIKADTNAVVMGNHGVVCFGRSLEEAYYKLEILDAYCRILLLARPLGRPNLFTMEQMRELLKLKGTFGEKDNRIEDEADLENRITKSLFLRSFEQ